MSFLFQVGRTIGNLLGREGRVREGGAETRTGEGPLAT